MAAERAEPARFTRDRDSPWTSDRIAHELVPMRDRLVERLPREIAAARDLTLDQRELVVDDAIDYMVTEYAKPIVVRDELDRAFWAAASFRVRRAHEGRGATIRGGFRRAPAEDLDQLSSDDDPETAVVRRDERLMLLEFVGTLTPQERQVFAYKYGSGPKSAGRNQLSRWLELPIGEVRKAERNIARKLDRFVTLVSAGALCSFRSGAIASLASRTASDEEATAARLHLKRCTACRTVYAEHVHALRSGELQGKIAGLLPAPIMDSVGEDRPVRGFLLDFLSRPFGGEPTAALTHAASSGAGRGLGSLAAVKLASICIGGAAITGGICVSLQGTGSAPRDAVERRATPSASTSPKLAPKIEQRRAEPSTTPTSAPTHRKTRATDRSPTNSQGPRKHETTTAVSPPPANAQPAGVDEFGPSSATTPSTPAAAPATGAPEFP